MREFELQSTGGGMLHCGIWAPKGTTEPRAILQLVHGIAEHIGRYERAAEFFSDHGFLVIADDHMGHGKTVGAKDVKGYFPSGWLGAVEDEWNLMKRVREEYPHTPYFILGHSMGSFLTRTFLYRYADAKLRGVILSGTGWQPKPVLAAGLMLCRREEKKFGPTGVSQTLQDVVFGGYNRKFKPTRTDNDWICTDEKVVDAYCADPLCGFPATVGLAREMLGGIRMNQDKKNLDAMPKDLPVLFFAGQQDPVGDMGRGVERSAEAFRDAGLRDVTVKLYPNGRHEMFNEPNYLEVQQDVLQWIEARLR